MKNRIIRPAVAALCALAGALLFTACKENTIIRGNQNIVPDSLTPSMVLTDIDTRTVHDDSVLTSGMGSFINHSLGSYTGDPYAGDIDASIFLQFLPPVTGWKVPSGFTLDSVVAVLPYSGFSYGDTASGQSLSFNAYAIDTAATFTMDNTYFAFGDLPTGSAVVGTGFKANYDALKATVYADSATRPAHLRIPVTAILPSLQRAIDDDNSYTSFLSHFKGLRITPAGTPTRLLPFFRLDGTTTTPYTSASLQVYAHSSSKDTAFTFPFNFTYAGHFNRVRRNTTPSANNLYGTELVASVVSGNRPRMILHYEPGGTFDIRIKGIQSIPQSIINKAELVITVDESANNSAVAPPPRIYPIGLDAGTGGQYNILDRFPLASTEPLVFIDGTLRTESNGTRAYHINIPREIQRIRAAGGDELRLKITGLQTFPGAYRLLAYGNDPASPNRIRLNIVYTRQLQ